MIAFDDLAHRRGGSAQRREIAAHREDRAARWDAELGRRAIGEHLSPRSASSRSSISVGDVEVAVDEHVEDRPEQEALLGLAVLRPLQLEPRGATSSMSTGVPSLRWWRTVSSQPGPVTMSISRLLDHRRGALAVVHRHVEVVAVAHAAWCARAGRGSRRPRSAHAELGLERVQLVLVGGRLGVDPEHAWCSGSHCSRRSSSAMLLAARLARRRNATRGSRTRQATVQHVADADRFMARPRRSRREQLREQTRRVARRAPARGLDRGDRRRRHRARRRRAARRRSTTRRGCTASARRASPRPRGRPSTAPGCRSRRSRRAGRTR